MRKFILALATCLIGSSFLTASCGPSYSNSYCINEKQNWPSAVTIDAGVGFRRDSFEWSLGGEQAGSDVLSKLKWSDLRIVQVEGLISYTSPRNYVIRVSGDYGHIYHGDNKDEDFNIVSGKKQLFSKSRNDAGKGNVYDLDAALGYRFTSNGGRFIFVPLAGYGFHGQDLHIYGGKQVFSDDFLPLGRIRDLNSKYQTRWFGPWLGFDFVTKVENCAYLFGGFAWNWLSYRGEGHWNLRPDISHFKHNNAYGYGYNASLGGCWEIWNSWSIGIVGRYHYYHSNHGHEKIRVRNTASGETVVTSRFNGARWKGASATAIIGYRF